MFDLNLHSLGFDIRGQVGMRPQSPKARDLKPSRIGLLDILRSMGRYYGLYWGYIGRIEKKMETTIS